MNTASPDLDTRRLANAIRALAMDAVQAANSGHPGLPMGMADAATVLFSKFLKFDANDPAWPDRDRFVLSAGHGSMLLYALLFLTGYPGITIEDIKRFRQLGSPCAGHPEYGHIPGIETTTGPLGQGIATAVGMAMAERHLAARYGKDLVDHKTYVIASDGDLMEGISHEAISLAGHLKLSKLIVLYDSNNITIDGAASLSDSTDPRQRFEAAKWAVHECDGLNGEEVSRALLAAQESDRPVLIICHTIIGYGAPKKAGTSKAHGEALGTEEIEGARKNLDWPYAPFEIPDGIFLAWRTIGQQGKAAHEDWAARKAKIDTKDFDATLKTEIPEGFAAAIAAHKKAMSAAKPMATRKASEAALEVINAAVPIRSAARPTSRRRTTPRPTTSRPSHPTISPAATCISASAEHGMAAAMNGMAPAWRHHPVWRHVPDLLRLLQAGDTPRRADGQPCHLCDDA